MGTCIRTLGITICTCLIAIQATSAREAPKMPKLDTFNYVIGTQTIGAAYQFTEEPALVETAKAILDMGSNTLKFTMSKNYHGRKSSNTPDRNPKVHSLKDLASLDPAHKQVLDMPFANYVIWTYPFNSGWWDKGFSKADQEKEYREIHDFVSYLLKTYSGTGKTFYIGHWEGDWHLRPSYDLQSDIPAEAIQGMIDWLNVRQKAVDDAKRDTRHHDVQVYNYTEVNLVQIGIEGRKCLTNDVLPKTSVDFVSYSSYDTQDDPKRLKAALDYIESKLPPKAGIPGKRVFIGEYGFPAAYAPEKQDEKSRQVMRVGLEWGCPFVLYWEMFNNEVDKEGKNRGFWLIDDKGTKQPIYHTHQKLYQWARQYVSDYTKEHGRKPTPRDYGEAAAAYLLR